MTVSQARTGTGARADNLPGRLAAIKAPPITPEQAAAARNRLQREHDADYLADALGLDERNGQ